MQIYGVLQFVGSFNINANIISEELMNSSKIYTNPTNTAGYYYKYTYLQQVKAVAREGGATGACAPPFQKKKSTFSKNNTT